MDFIIYEWDSNESRDSRTAWYLSALLSSKGYKNKILPFSAGPFPCILSSPKVVIFVNLHGSLTALKLASKIFLSGFKVLAMYGEGNFRHEAGNQMTYGHASEEELFADFYCLWNQKSQRIVKEISPALFARSKVTGALQADICIAEGKLRRKCKNKSEKKVVGIGCWDFGLLSSKDKRHYLFINQLKDSEIARINFDRIKFGQVLKDVALDNPDIIFKYRRHPMEQVKEHSTGFYGYSMPKNFEEFEPSKSLYDCFEESAWWLTYESTTGYEATLFGCLVCMLVPSNDVENDSWRSNVHTIQPVFRDGEELTKFLLSGSNKSFDANANEVLKSVYGSNLGHASSNVLNLCNELLNQEKTREKKVINILGIGNLVRLFVYTARKIAFIEFVLVHYFGLREWDKTKIRKKVERYAKYIKENEI